jgi:hypothetical protein
MADLAITATKVEEAEAGRIPLSTGNLALDDVLHREAAAVARSRGRRGWRLDQVVVGWDAAVTDLKFTGLAKQFDRKSLYTRLEA